MEPSVGQFTGPGPGAGGGARGGRKSTGAGRYLTTLRAHVKLIALCVLVTFIGAVAYVKLAPKSYTATAQMLVSPIPNQDSALETIPVLLHASGDPTTDVLTAASIVHTQRIAQATAGALHSKETAAQILGKVSVVPTDQSELLSISTSSSDPRQAQRLVDAFANQIVAVRTAQLHSYIASVLPSLKASLARSPGATTTGGTTADLIQQLEALQSGPDSTVTVSSLAPLPTVPTSPKTSLSLVAGILIGLLIGAALAFGIEALDPPVRGEGELRERFAVAPVLARIPQRSGPPRPGPLTPMDLSGAALEQYRTLRATIPMRARQGKGHTFLVCSADQAEGKSTTAIGLAAVLAQSGTDVLLIDADLRRPSVGNALGLTTRDGIEAVLSGDIELSEAVQQVRLGTATTLSVLPAQGTGVEYADQLLSPAAALRLLQAAERRAEVIIIDSPPLTAVSDALPFARAVDDVLLVVRMGQTKLSKLSESWELLGHQHTHPSGLILVGVRPPSGAAYGYNLHTNPADWLATTPPEPARPTVRTSTSRHR
jgi:capsular exopolysaccharide synthesis family protein